jgi:hypothetical protein
MEVTTKLSVKLKSPSGEKFEIIFNTENHYILNKLIEEYGYGDHKVISWKLKRVVFIS